MGTTDRNAVLELLKLEEYIDVMIPRGGEDLIRFVTEHARMPVLKHYKGVCHVYVDAEADLEMAEKICLNAKVQRPGVCNAMETLLVHRDVAGSFSADNGCRFPPAKAWNCAAARGRGPLFPIAWWLPKKTGMPNTLISSLR